jgi:hypothetical protein
VKASQSLISPTTLKKWLDSLSSWGDIAAAFAKGLGQGVANLGNAAQDVGVGLLNVPAASVNFGSWASEKLFFDVPDHMNIRIPYIPSPDWSKGLVTQESDFHHGLSKGALGFAASVLGPGAIGRIRSAAAIGTMPLSARKATGAYLPGAAGGGSGLGLFETHSVRVSQKGLELIRNHLSRFGNCEQNSMMMQRLRSAAADGCTISGADARFKCMRLQRRHLWQEASATPQRMLRHSRNTGCPSTAFTTLRSSLHCHSGSTRTGAITGGCNDGHHYPAQRA